jgi:hypothetical protein
LAVDALDEHYKIDDKHFEEAVYEASRKRLQELVIALDQDRTTAHRKERGQA